MKKIISVFAVAAVLVSSTFAFDMNIGLKGLMGADNSGTDGVLAGGGVDLNLDLYKGLGVQIESNIITTALSSGDGLNCENHFTVNIPVMGYYNFRYKMFGLGAGAGINCSISDTVTQPDGSNIKFGLASGLNAKIYLNDNFAIVLGATGTLDCLPTLVKSSSGSSTNYKFEKSDFSRNSIYGSLGLMYRLPVGNN